MRSIPKLLTLLSAFVAFVAGQSATTADDQFTPLLSITDQNANGGPIYSNCYADNNWAMTYDDGPAEPTMKLLNILDNKGIKATFFVVGQMAQANPGLVKEAYNRGHEIGLHTWTHPYLTKLSNAQIIQEAKSTYDLIKSIIGVGPVFFRPPYGDYNNRVIEILTKMGFTIVTWNLDTQDALSGPDGVYNRTAALVPNFNKAVVLEHDRFANLVDQAENVINLVQTRGPKFVRMSECLGLSPYGDLKVSGFPERIVVSTTTTTTTAATTSQTVVATKVVTTTAAANSTASAPSATKTSASDASYTSNLLLIALAYAYCLL